MTNKMKKNIKIAAYSNIAHGILATIFVIFYQFNVAGFANFMVNTQNQTYVNTFMFYQILIVVTGVVAVVFSVLGRQPEKMIWYMGAVAIAGLNTTIILFAASATVFSPFNIVCGVMMLRKKKEEKKVEDLEF